MARDISLSDLKEERRELGRRIDLLDRVIADLEKIAASNGHLSKRPHSEKIVIHTSGAIPLTPPTIRDIVTNFVRESPGIHVRDAVRKAAPSFAGSSTDPKKLVSTRIGQFVRAGQLRRQGDQLFLPEGK